MTILRVSSMKEEGQQRLSKWLKQPMLLDEEEMRSLFKELSPFSIFNVSEPVTSSRMQISQEEFLGIYAEYIQALKEGRTPDEKKARHYFSSVFTTQPDLLYAMQVGKEKFLVKAIKPVIQLQAHHFYFSEVDGLFHSMTLSDKSLSWGIQFSYAQIYQGPNDVDFSRVVDSPEFPNTKLFQNLGKWMRRHTLPTPFLLGDKQVNVPFRLGKECFSWIQNHHGLKSESFKIKH